MPSGYVRDPDKEFFEICRRAYPYFIHTDSNFLNDLIPLMRAIDIAHNDMNKADLYELVQRATDLLDGWDEGHKGVMTDLIRRHYFRVTSFDDRFAELYDLAKGTRGKKADKELSELKEKVEQLSIEVSKLKTLIAERPAQILSPHSSIALSAQIQTEEVPKEAEKIKLRTRLSRNEIEQRLELLKNYLKTNKEINNSKCREICNVNMYQAKRLLYKLVKDNFIEQIGVSSGTKYIVKE
ncbi:Uncharacterised protein [uncultured archaeon]|nr:Uncharacterised protein [uncultured archaeon]